MDWIDHCIFSKTLHHLLSISLHPCSRCRWTTSICMICTRNRNIINIHHHLLDLPSLMCSYHCFILPLVVYLAWCLVLGDSCMYLWKCGDRWRNNLSDSLAVSGRRACIIPPNPDNHPIFFHWWYQNSYSFCSIQQSVKDQLRFKCWEYVILRNIHWCWS